MSSTHTVTLAAIATAQAIASAFVILLMGAFAQRFSLLTPNSNKELSLLVGTVLESCLAFSSMLRLSANDIATGGPLLFWPVIHVALSLLLGYTRSFQIHHAGVRYYCALHLATRARSPHHSCRRSCRRPWTPTQQPVAPSLCSSIWSLGDSSFGPSAPPSSKRASRVVGRRTRMAVAEVAPGMQQGSHCACCGSACYPLRL